MSYIQYVLVLLYLCCLGAQVNMCIKSGLISNPIPYKDIVNMSFVDNHNK